MNRADCSRYHVADKEFCLARYILSEQGFIHHLHANNLVNALKESAEPDDQWL